MSDEQKPERPTAEQVLRSLEQEHDEGEIPGEADVDAEIARAMAMTPEERRAELKEMGVDVAALDAKAAALHEAAKKSAADEVRARAETQARKRASEPQRRRPGVYVLLAAALVVAVVVGLTLVLRDAPPSPTPRPGPAPSASAPPMPELVARAKETRERAYAYCDNQEWTMCVLTLDQARQLDPAGDYTPEVRAARDRAYQGLMAKPDAALKPPL
jgi:hypothetical protein